MVTPYVNEPFPSTVARGATGGPEYRTDVVEMMSGAEQRNQNWANSRRSYNISTGIRKRADMDLVIAHFEAVGKGRAFSFPFKDWGDYELSDYQGLVVIDATHFQCVKRYITTAKSHVRTITKPVNGTLLLKVSGVLKTEGVDYTVDYTTGIVTYSPAPGATPSAKFAFNVPVRYDTDALPIATMLDNQLAVQRIDLKEVIGE